MSVGFLSDFCWISVVLLFYAVVFVLDFCGMSFGLCCISVGFMWEV